MSSKGQQHNQENSLIDISILDGVSNWLTVLPINKCGFELSKLQLWDSIRLLYKWQISNLPTSCPRGSKFDIQHSMSCKKGGFVYMGHNDFQDLKDLVSFKR